MLNINIKVCSLLKLRNGLIENYHAIYHYSYNVPLSKMIALQVRPPFAVII